jgi:hypothetical protein
MCANAHKASQWHHNADLRKCLARKCRIVEVTTNREYPATVGRSETRAVEWSPQGLHAHSKQCNTHRRYRAGSFMATSFTNLGIQERKVKRLSSSTSDDQFARSWDQSINPQPVPLIRSA